MAINLDVSIELDSNPNIPDITFTFYSGGEEREQINFEDCYYDDCEGEWISNNMDDVLEISKKIKTKEEKKILSQRFIKPKSKEDFANWLYELIVHWESQPEIGDEESKNKTIEILQNFPEKVKLISPFWDECPFSLSSLKIYTTDDVLKILNEKGLSIAKRTLRHYETIGLIPQNDQRGKGRKRYDGKTVNILIQVVELRKQGKKYEAIKDILKAKYEKFYKGKKT